MSTRSKRSSWLWCKDCTEWLLRSERQDHFYHDTIEEGGPPVADMSNIPDLSDDDEGEVEENEEPREVGGVYEIRLSYSVDYSFQVIAHSERSAKEKADEKVDFGNAVDAMHMHTDKRKIETIDSDDDRAEEHDLLP